MGSKPIPSIFLFPFPLCEPSLTLFSPWLNTFFIISILLGIFQRQRIPILIQTPPFCLTIPVILCAGCVLCAVKRQLDFGSSGHYCSERSQAARQPESEEFITMSQTDRSLNTYCQIIYGLQWIILLSCGSMIFIFSFFTMSSTSTFSLFFVCLKLFTG